MVQENCFWAGSQLCGKTTTRQVVREHREGVGGRWCKRTAVEWVGDGERKLLLGG